MGVWVAEPVRARRLTDQEGRKLQQIVRRGRHESIRVRRAMMIMALAFGDHGPGDRAAGRRRTRTPSATSSTPSTNKGWSRWTLSGREAVPARSQLRTRSSSSRRPPHLRPGWDAPFTHWSVRKLADHLDNNTLRHVKIGRERLRQLLRTHGISFQRTRTWKESTDPDKDAKLDRIEEVTSKSPDRCFAFDRFGPPSIRPCHGTCWAQETRPDRLPATHHRTHGVRCFHGCYSIGDDRLWGVNRQRKGVRTPSER
jgi:hypothetical protein